MHLDFSPWQRYAVIGMTQSGKTTWVKRVLMPVITNYMVVDPKRHLSECGMVCRTVKELISMVQQGYTHIILQPDLINENVLEELCYFVFHKVRNTMLFIDELQLFCSRQSIPPSLMSVATAGEGKPLRLGLCVTLQSASDIHPHIKRNLSHVVSFKQFLEADVDYLVRNFGSGFSQVRELPPYHALYWNNNTARVVGLTPVE